MTTTYAERCAEERRRRINVAVWAYAYEVMDDPLVSDEEFDSECALVDLKLSTSYKGKDNRAIDRWFRENFEPHTGMWVHNHPDKDGLHLIYQYMKLAAGGRPSARSRR